MKQTNIHMALATTGPADVASWLKPALGIGLK